MRTGLKGTPSILPIEGKQPPRFLPQFPVGSQPKWSPREDRIAYIETRSNVSNIWVQPVAGGKSRQITHFSEGQIFAFDWARDGTDRLALVRGEVTEEIFVLTKDASEPNIGWSLGFLQR